MNRSSKSQDGDKAVPESITPIVKSISDALIKYVTVASQHGVGCYVMSDLGRRLLEDRGISAELNVGWAAWRFGPNPLDFAAYAPIDGDFVNDGPENTPALPYHTWLVYRGCIIDFTTYDLRRAATLLERADGMRTTVTWCPNFLILPKADIRPLTIVTHASKPGTCYYERRQDLEHMINAGYTLDAEDLQNVRAILASPNATIAGHYGVVKAKQGTD